MDHFYGYGSWQTPVWFVGYEESGGDIPEEVADKLNYFLATHGSVNGPTLCDLRDVYQRIAFQIDGPRADKFVNRYDYRFGPHAVLHGVWKNLISFTHGFQNRKLPDLLSYQKESFGNGEEAWVQLYPLPGSHNHAWYYNWLDLPGHAFLKSRTLYEEHVYESRINIILQQIIKHKPEVVLMYGMKDIRGLKQSVQARFPDAEFKMIKSIKQRIPQHHRTHLNETELIITTQLPALRHGRIETGFDWYELGKMAAH